MKLLWSRRALAELDDIFAYVAASDPKAAEQLVLRIEQSAQNLVEYPDLGRPGRVDEARELVVAGTPYILPYRVREGRIEILAALHAARAWPDQI